MGHLEIEPHRRLTPRYLPLKILQLILPNHSLPVFSEHKTAYSIQERNIHSATSEAFLTTQNLNIVQGGNENFI